MSFVQRLNGWARKVPTWLVYVVAALPPIFLFTQALSGNIPGDPVKIIERELGERGLQILIAVLAITPVRTFTGINLIRFRRALGVSAFFYILLHFLVWVFLDVQNLANALIALGKYPYIWVGMSALVLLTPLAVTSNNWMLKKLGGPRWRSLHKLTYVILILGALHYILLSKVSFEPLVYLAIILALLLARVRLSRSVATA